MMCAAGALGNTEKESNKRGLEKRSFFIYNTHSWRAEEGTAT